MHINTEHVWKEYTGQRSSCVLPLLAFVFLCNVLLSLEVNAVWLQLTMAPSVTSPGAVVFSCRLTDCYDLAVSVFILLKLGLHVFLRFFFFIVHAHKDLPFRLLWYVPCFQSVQDHVKSFFAFLLASLAHKVQSQRKTKSLTLKILSLGLTCSMGLSQI